MSTILYAHDLDGSPKDPITRQLHRPERRVVAPDGRFKTLSRRVAELVDAAGDDPVLFLVGHGTGALVALAAAVALGPRVGGVLTLAPAVGWIEPPVWDPPNTALPSAPIEVIHAAESSAFEAEVRRAFTGHPKVTVHVVPGGPDLSAHTDLIARRFGVLAARVRPPREPKSPTPSSPQPRAPKAPKPPKPPKPLRLPKAAPPRVPKPKRPPPPPKVAVVFAHDFDGRPTDAPATLLHRWHPSVPDGFGRTFAARVAAVTAAVDAAGPCIVAGTGYGAVVAMAVALARPTLARGLLLLGPTLDVVEPGLDATEVALPRTLPVMVVQGSRDVVADLERTRALVARCPNVGLVVVDDTHTLLASGPAVVGALQTLQAAFRAVVRD